MTHENETREPRDRPPNRIGRGVSILVAALLIYVLSPIPFALGLEWLGVGERAESAFETFYAPLEFFCERFEIVENFYEWQVRLIDR